MTSKEMFARADDYFNAGNYEKCIYTCDKLIEKGYNAYDVRGNCFFELQMYEEAIDDYSVVIDEDKADIYIYIQRGSSCHSINDFINALNDFSFVIGQFDLNEKAKEKFSLKNHKIDTQLLIQTYRLRAILNYDMQRYSESLHDCEKCLQLMEKYGIEDNWSKTGIYLTKGNVLRGMMQWKYAENEYNKTLSYDSKNPHAYYGRFLVRLMLKDSLGGLEDLKDCVKFANPNSKIYQEASSFLNDINRNMERM